MSTGGRAVVGARAACAASMSSGRGRSQMSIGGREDEHQRAPEAQPSGHRAGSLRGPVVLRGRTRAQMSIRRASAGHQLAGR